MGCTGISAMFDSKRTIFKHQQKISKHAKIPDQGKKNPLAKFLAKYFNDLKYPTIEYHELKN